MSNKKITIASIVLAFLAVLLGIAFIFGHKTTAEKLQAQEWTLTSQEESNTVNFKKDNTMILGKELTVNITSKSKKQIVATH